MGGFLDGLFGGDDEEQTVTQTQETEPWGPLQKYLKDVWGHGQGLFDQGTSFYPGQTYADFNPYQTQGMQSQLGYAGGLLPDQVNSVLNAHQSALNAPDVANNPYLSDVADTITSRLNRNFTEGLLPSIRSQSIIDGQPGGSRREIAEGVGMRGTQESIGNSLSQLYGNAYGQGLGAQGRALAMAPQTMQTGLLPGMITQGIGGQYQAQDQRGISEDVARHDYGQNAPWQNLSNYAGLLSGGRGYGTTTGTTVQPKQDNGIFGNLLGTGMMAAGAMTGNPMFMSSGISSMFGGGGGGLAPVNSAYGWGYR